MTPAALADDVGITKARLIQTSERSYLLEADVTQLLVWAIKVPIFPDRFKVPELTYINQTGWIVVQATATTDGKPLTSKDEILLPWMRNGTALTVQWLDGSIEQGLFLRALEGIRIPLKALMPRNQSLGEVCRAHFMAGIQHLNFKWIHFILAAALVLLLPYRKAFSSLLFYSFGQGLSLVLADFGQPGVDLVFADLLGTILVFLLTVATAKEAGITPFGCFYFSLVSFTAWPTAMNCRSYYWHLIRRYRPCLCSIWPSRQVITRQQLFFLWGSRREPGGSWSPKRAPM